VGKVENAKLPFSFVYFCFDVVVILVEKKLLANEDVAVLLSKWVKEVSPGDSGLLMALLVRVLVV
jgi:hypothetical protein